MTNLQKNPEYHNISLSERQGKVGGWLRGQLQSRIARPLSFRAKHAPCHCNQSMPSVISSEARSAKSRNLFIRAKPSLCHFERSPKGAVEKSAYPTKTYRPPAVASCRVAAPCHFERSTSFVISSDARPHCHFERSTKCEVEKSAYPLGRDDMERGREDWSLARTAEWPGEMRQFLPRDKAFIF